MANVGSIDRTIRFVVGLLLVVFPFVPQTAALLAGWGNWAYAVPVIGLVMLATAIFRFCPAYTLFGVRTCETGR